MRLFGSAAQAFEAHRAGAGEAVVNHRVLKQGGEYVEEGLLDAIRNRPRRLIVLRRQNYPASKLPRDNPHVRYCLLATDYCLLSDISLASLAASRYPVAP